MIKKSLILSVSIILFLWDSNILWAEQTAEVQDIQALENEIIGLRQKLQDIDNRKAALEPDVLKGQSREAEDISQQETLKEYIRIFHEENQELKDNIYSLEREIAIMRAIFSAEFSPVLRGPLAIRAQGKNWDKIISLNLGFAYGMKGMVTEALKKYNEALYYDPLDRDIHYNLGYLLAAAKKYDQAVAEFNKALKGTPEDKEVYYNLAVIYAAGLDDYNKATEYYHKFLEFSTRTNF